MKYENKTYFFLSISTPVEHYLDILGMLQDLAEVIRKNPNEKNMFVRVGEEPCGYATIFTVKE